MPADTVRVEGVIIRLEWKVLCVIACLVSSLFQGHALDDFHVDGVGASRRSCLLKKNSVFIDPGSVCSLTLLWIGVSVFIDLA